MSLDLQRTLLNCSALPTDWYRSYGLTESRSNAIIRRQKDRNSFFNPQSETALTTFLLCNLDGWHQLQALTPKPRQSGSKSKWSEKFFRALRNPNPQQPVLIDSEALKETAVFSLPAGFVVDETPEAVNLETPFGKYTTSYEVKDGKLFFTRSLTLPRNRTICNIRLTLDDDPDNNDASRASALIDYVRIWNGNNNGIRWNESFAKSN